MMPAFLLRQSLLSVPAPLAKNRRLAARSWGLFVFFAFELGLGCQAEKPPAPVASSQAKARANEAAATARFDPKSMTAVITYAGDRGEFRDTNKVEDVPAEARKLVRVKLLDGAVEPPGAVWIADLTVPTSDGAFELRPLPRDQFEESALGQGRFSKVDLANAQDGSTMPRDPADMHEDIIVYKTAWCGACKQLQAYLDRKGVKYVAKDIEASPQAAQELAAKAQKAGVPLGSVPVVDVRGQVMVGFDRARLEAMLAAH